MEKFPVLSLLELRFLTERRRGEEIFAGRGDWRSASHGALGVIKEMSIVSHICKEFLLLIKIYTFWQYSDNDESCLRKDFYKKMWVAPLMFTSCGRKNSIPRKNIVSHLFFSVPSKGGGSADSDYFPKKLKSQQQKIRGDFWGGLRPMPVPKKTW